MKKHFVFLVLITQVFLGCHKILDELKPYLEADGKNTIIKNADFEKLINFSVSNTSTAWNKEGWKLEQGEFTWAKDLGRNNSGGISLGTGSTEENDIAITQRIKVKAGKTYRLSAWIKTENVVGGRGANLGLFGTFINSGPLTGTNDWSKISFSFLAPSTGEVTIACRLGFWGETSTGTAYFDELTLEEVERFDRQSQHIRLILDKEDVSSVKSQTIDAWLNNLDKAYEKYYELMGAYPYNGEKITILSVEAYPGGWAIAGNPILWHKPYVKSELQNIEATGSWSFGILHEIGHDFALDHANHSWIWNEEMFANFRMYYVVETLNASVLQDKLYTGSELTDYYKTYAVESYDNTIAKGIAQGHDAVMYTLIRIKDKIGWDAFKKTYRHLNNSTVNPATNWEKFSLYLDKLSEYSGENVRATYLPGELDTIKQLLSK